ncbi:hypothetical protein M231_06896 [Tremella mesenterica]|uniref:Uncharacterized protein n=1 Tax=Tremella mesenterica TaxID=5217 RepID=A0A4Q1BAP3_TREME|nr:hypothetical protein M231_06896 [Tremella mesenterica]
MASLESPPLGDSMPAGSSTAALPHLTSTPTSKLPSILLNPSRPTVGTRILNFFRKLYREPYTDEEPLTYRMPWGHNVVVLTWSYGRILHAALGAPTAEERIAAAPELASIMQRASGESTQGSKKDPKIMRPRLGLKALANRLSNHT